MSGKLCADHSTKMNTLKVSLCHCTNVLLLCVLQLSPCSSNLIFVAVVCRSVDVLSIGMCLKLKRASLDFTCLDTLDLSMLDSLSRLEIKCDHLGLLLLSGCSRSVVTLPSTSKII